MGRNKYLYKNTIIFAIGSLSTKFISFLMVPLYTYVLTTSQYGITDLAFTFSMLLTPLVALNIHEAIMRFSLDKNANRKNIICTGFAIFMAGSVLSLLIIPLLFFVPILNNYAILVYLLIWSTTLFYITQSYLKGIEKLKFLAVSNILSTFLLVAFNVVFLLAFHWGINGYLLASIFSYIITSLIIIVFGKMKQYFIGFYFDKKMAKEMLKYSIALVPNSMLWWVTNSSDRFMVTAFCGTSANGIYAVAYKLPTLLSNISNIFQQAWQFSAIMEVDSIDKDAYNSKVFRMYSKFIFVISSFLILVQKPLLKIYVDNKFFDAWKYTSVLIIAFALLSFASFVGTYYTVAKNNIGMMLSAVCGAIVNIILNLILIPQIGIQGASVATCFGYFSILLYRVIDTQKYVKLQVFNKQFILCLLILVLQVWVSFLQDGTNYIFNAIGFILISLLSKDLIAMIYTGIINKLKSLCKLKEKKC